MTTEEFVAWFDGFTRRIKGRPSTKDWSEIIAALSRVDDASPLKAWFEGLLIKVKSVPSEGEWTKIRRKVSEAQAKPSKRKPGLNDSFKSFSKKPGAETASASTRLNYPGSKPFGKK